jgi:protein SCO1/2
MKLALRMTVLLLGAASFAASAELPGDSIYQLEAGLTTQDGKSVNLDRYRGQPTMVSMFYATCPHVCPTLIHSIQRLENQLEPEQRKRLRVLLISVDPERDTPAALTELAKRHRADLSRWTFAQPREEAVRQIAAVLGIQYRKLPDGEFNHSTIITLLDPQGRAIAKTSLIGRLDEEFLKRLRSAMTP